MSYLHVPPFWKLQQCIGYTTCIQYQNFTLNFEFTFYLNSSVLTAGLFLVVCTFLASISPQKIFAQ